MTTKMERGLRNSAQITRDDVSRLMFIDGFGEEALDYATEYAIELTGCTSLTVIAHVERHIRCICRGLA